ncbi:MAG: hypothetical protein HY054_14065 [Proteobacteria bacterium]|nr:hypothetical protein [Pseudomonadota bacterium]
MMNRVLGVLLIVGAIVTGLYWWSYFTGGDVMATHERWYTAFESSFPVADGWMALCMAAAGAGFVMRRGWASPLWLMAGSALIYLGCMDMTFNVENGMYALAAANDAMKFEVFINVTTLILGVWTLVASWPRQQAQ